MAITYTGTGGLFTILGQIFGAHGSLNTVRTTTIKNQIQQAIDAYKLKTDADLDFDRSINAAAAAERTWRQQGDTFASSLARDAAGLVIETMKAESNRTGLNQLADALQFLYDQMVADGYWVTASVVSATYSADAGNSSTDLALFAYAYDHLTRRLAMTLQEDIEVLCTSGGLSLDEAAVASLRFRGQRKARSKLSEEFPAGSGIDRTIAPLTVADNSILTNGGFEDATVANIPDDWIIVAGVPGSTINLTSYEKQTVAISGSPSAGTYHLKITDPITSLVHSTEALAYNASGSTVQTAIREVTGLAVDLSEVEVTTTGTSPNFTHTIEFVGVAGNLAALTVLNNTTGGSFNVAQVTAGSNLAIKGRGLIFEAHASVLQHVAQPIVLQPDTVYFCGYWLTPSTTPTQGVLFAGIGDETAAASTVADHAGNDVGDTVDLTTITSKTARYFFFSLPSSVGSPLYMKFEKNTAEPTADIVIDEVVLAEATQLYAGGPYVAAMQGKVPVLKDDLWTLDVDNSQNAWHLYFDRFFDMAGKGLTLPDSGSTNISTALIG